MKMTGLFPASAAALAATPHALAQKFTNGTRMAPETRVLKPGEFVWEAERSPSGPVILVVSKPEQMAYVYRNGIRIARTTVRTGKTGHETPVRVFRVPGKEKMHGSNLYKGAPMPFMERLAWTGLCGPGFKVMGLMETASRQAAFDNGYRLPGNAAAASSA